MERLHYPEENTIKILVYLLLENAPCKWIEHMHIVDRFDFK